MGGALMGLFKTNRTMNRINKMIENAVEGNPITDTFDESKLSALETKFANYLSANGTSKQQLQKEKENINTFISDISHQTKTPMANIMLYTQLLNESYLPAESQQLVTAITAQTEKLNFLIASLVKASRLETGIITVNPVKTKVSSVLSVVVSQVDRKISDKEIQLEVNVQEIDAIFDSKWTAEALYNILDNAVKYTPRNGTIKISTTCYQLFARIDIEDNGIGIPEGDIPKIFKRFYRSHEVSNEEGVGIGLYLSREIISKQGGYIKVKSQVGEGSLFSVFLPIS